MVLQSVSKLASAPASPPRYSVRVRNAAGAEVALGDPRATRALVALMDVHAVNGGAACHWGGPAAFAEIMSAIHGFLFAVKDRPWHAAYNFINDAGHTENGIYALRANYGFDGMTFEDLKGFRSLQSKLTGHGESHLNPQGVLLSNGPLGSALPQAQGMAIADHLLQNDRVTICTVSDGASMEGEAKEAFAAIPGLAAKGLRQSFPAGDFRQRHQTLRPHHQGLLQHAAHLRRHERAGLERHPGAQRQRTLPGLSGGRARPGTGPGQSARAGLPVGQNHQGLRRQIHHGKRLRRARFSAGQWGENRRVCQRDLFRRGSSRRTGRLVPRPARRLGEKGRRQESQSRRRASRRRSAVKTEKIQAGLAKGAVRAAQEGFPVYSLSADLAGSTGMSFFQKSFPGRFLDLGVAEANMVSAGAGLAKAGLIPIVDTFGQFGVTKGNLPLTMSALSQAPVIAVFSHVGFQDAADGASHQATTYFAAISAIPHTVVIACSCSDEAEALMYQAIKRLAHAREHGADGESVVFFVGRENYPAHLAGHAHYEWGKAQTLAVAGTS